LRVNLPGLRLRAGSPVFFDASRAFDVASAQQSFQTQRVTLELIVQLSRLGTNRFFELAPQRVGWQLQPRL
jgi:hypothetical protein